MNLQVVGMGCLLMELLCPDTSCLLPTVQKLRLQFMFIDSLFIPKLSKKKQLNMWKIGSFQHDFCMYPQVASLHPTTGDQLLSDHLTLENFTKSPSDCENLQPLETVKTNPELFSRFQP